MQESEQQEQSGAGEDATSAGQNAPERQRLPFGKLTQLLAILFLFGPPLIPLTFLPGTDPGSSMFLLLIAFSVTIFIVNAVVLYMLYKWMLLMTADEDKGA